MTFKGGERFNGKHRPGRRERGRRTEEGADHGDNRENQDLYDDSEGDPRPVRTPGRRPFPPRIPNIAPDPQVRRIEVKAETEDDILAGIRLVVSMEITNAEVRKAATPSGKD